jgi:hypothetical protein
LPLFNHFPTAFPGYAREPEGAEHAEFVVLGAGENHPRDLLALPDVGASCAEPDEPLNFGVLVVGPQVEVEPVLRPLPSGTRMKRS